MNHNKQILKQQIDHYDDYVKISDNPRYKKIWNYLSKSNQGGRLLDIGCSNGDFSEPLIKRGYECHGLEYMDRAIVESEGKGMKIKKGSFLDKFPYENGYFDIVFAGEVIEHTIDDSIFLKEVSRVLKKNGILIVTTPNLVSLGNRILMVIGKMPRFAYHEFHYKIYNKDLLRKKIIMAGFNVLGISSNYILISTFYNKFVGLFGELLGSIFPSFGENFIVYAKKK